MICSFIDRNWNLLFHRKKCIQLHFKSGAFDYNDILITPGGMNVRYLGKTWYKLIKDKTNENIKKTN